MKYFVVPNGPCVNNIGRREGQWSGTRGPGDHGRMAVLKEKGMTW